MKVIQILPKLDPGGAQYGALEMAKALIQAGHKSIVISGGGELVTRLERDQSTHITMPMHQKNLKALWQVGALKKVIAEHKPDIIHVRARLPAWVTHLALKRLPEHERPIVVSTVHTLYPATKYSSIITKADKVICVSDYALSDLKSKFNVAEDKLVRIYRGIDPKAFPYRYQPSVHWWNNTLAEFPELDNKIWLTLPGSISESTGHQWLIDIIGGLKDELPNVHGVIIGEPKDADSNYFDELQLRIHALGLQERITFTGTRSDSREWLAASNIVFELSNKPKSFGRNVLEALFVGTPVIAWDKGGISEILNQLYPEGLIADDDCIGLCNLVRKHLHTNQNIKQSTSQSRPMKPKKPERFILKHMTNQAMKVYQSLLAQKAGQGLSMANQAHSSDKPASAPKLAQNSPNDQPTQT